jgi:hypothetical protein
MTRNAANDLTGGHRPTATGEGIESDDEYEYRNKTFYQ